MKYLAFLTLLAICSPGISARSYANEFGLVGGNRAFSLKVTSYKAQRFETVVPQQYDYSCGSAALATLLKYHYEIPVTEQEVLDSMYETGNKEKIRTQGFSLLDMKQYLETMGLKADGFWIDLDKARVIGVPGIVLINTNGYMHFVVVKGITPTHVLLGDPARGIRKLTYDEFNKIWNNIFFAIRNNTGRARLSFLNENDWPDRQSDLISIALSDQALSSLSIHTAITPGVYY